MSSSTLQELKSVLALLQEYKDLVEEIEKEIPTLSQKKSIQHMRHWPAIHIFSHQLASAFQDAESCLLGDIKAIEINQKENSLTEEVENTPMYQEILSGFKTALFDAIQTAENTGEDQEIRIAIVCAEDLPPSNETLH